MYLNGYGNTGIKEITDAVDIPKGSFYNHFSSKQEFGLAIIDYYRANFMQKAKNILSDKSFPPIQRLKNFIDISIEMAETQFSCKLGCLVGNFSQELGDVNDEFAAALKNAFNDMNGFYVTCIQEAKDDNSIKSNYSAEDLADFVINAWEGALIRMKSDRNTNQLKLVRKVLVQTVLT